MKQTLLFLVLALGMCSINVSAQTKKQTPVKKTTTTRRATPSTTKTRQVGKDGYIWYKLKRGNLYGAQNLEGKEIVPVKYTSLKYVTEKIRYFEVKSGDYMGVYTRKGTLVVSTDRHYTSVVPPDISVAVSGMVCWQAKKNDGGLMILDAKGNEAFSAEQYSGVSMNATSDEGTNIYYFQVRRNGKEGICDLNGKELLPPEYRMCFLRNRTKATCYSSYIYSFDEDLINSIGTTRFDYNTYDDLFNYSYTHSSSSSSSSSSTSSSSKSSSSSSSSSSSTASSNSSSKSNNSGNNTTTVVVEHRRDPIPVQEWQQCTNCWGEGRVMCLGACGGTGTYYAGDRLNICNSCGGTGKKICPYCGGKGGKNITVYK